MVLEMNSGGVASENQDGPPGWEGAAERRKDIYAIRGEIVSLVAGLESLVDLHIGMYFVSLPAKDHETFSGRPGEFRHWILVRLGLSEKIEILERIASQLGVREKMTIGFRELRFANEFRAEQAHSSVDFNIDGIEEGAVLWDEFLKWQAIRVTKRGVQTKTVDIAELRNARDRVEHVALWVLCLGAAICSPDDPSAAMDQFLQSNAQNMS